jgi:hypothetical protein
MHHIFVFASFAASLFLPATAAPVSSRNVTAPNGGDISILNYALTLEFLERRFYTEGLQNFTAQDFQNAGFSPDFYEQMKTVLKDEQVRPSTPLETHWLTPFAKTILRRMLTSWLEL